MIFGDFNINCNTIIDSNKENCIQNTIQEKEKLILHCLNNLTKSRKEILEKQTSILNNKNQFYENYSEITEQIKEFSTKINNYNRTIIDLLAEIQDTNSSSELFFAIENEIKLSLESIDEHFTENLQNLIIELENTTDQFLNSYFLTSSDPEDFFQKYEKLQFLLKKFVSLKECYTNINTKKNFYWAEKSIGFKMQYFLKQLKQHEEELKLPARELELNPILIEKIALIQIRCAIKKMSDTQTTISEMSDMQSKHVFKNASLILPSSSGNNLKVTRAAIPSIPKLKSIPVIDQTVATKRISKEFRRYQMRKKLKNVSEEQVDLQIKKGEKYESKINPRIREPLVDLQKSDTWILNDNSYIAQAQRAIVKASKVGSYNKFVRSLRLAFSDTLQKINESPLNKRDYVILADEVGKSTNWVVSHLQDMISAHPPVDIVTRDKLHDLLQNHPNIIHIVMLDDAAYSGLQAADNLMQLTINNPNCELHVTIPYMTSIGKQAIQNALEYSKNKFHIHNIERMFSYDELINQGKIFSITDRVIVDSRVIQDIELPNDENSDLKSEINRQLEEVKKMVQRRKDKRKQYEKILDVIVFISNHTQDLGEEGIQLIQQLFRTIKLEHDQEQEQKLIKSYVDEKRYFSDFVRKTPSWFTHKGADSISTNSQEMENIFGTIPIEPYKDEKKEERKDQIKELKRQMQGRTIEKTVTHIKENDWLQDRVDFVETNRGFFLLGNSYVEETKFPHLHLHIHGKIINLGGINGEYQYKLKAGDEFELEDPVTKAKILLKLDISGKLVCL